MESRLRQIRKQLGLTQEKMAVIVGCSKSNISMIERDKSTVSKQNRRLLVQKFNINPLYLEGEDVPMFLPSEENEDLMNEAPELFPENVPLYDIEKAPSLAELFRRTGGGTSIETPKVGRPAKRPAYEEGAFRPVGWISFPGLSGCDGAVRVAGEGMSPILHSGDIVIYKQLGRLEDVFWGEMYLLSVETSAGEYVAVRYLRRSDKPGHAILGGENPSFADTEIELSKIRALAFVKASIRMNSFK